METHDFISTKLSFGQIELNVYKNKNMNMQGNSKEQMAVDAVPGGSKIKVSQTRQSKDQIDS